MVLSQSCSIGNGPMVTNPENMNPEPKKPDGRPIWLQGVKRKRVKRQFDLTDQQKERVAQAKRLMPSKTAVFYMAYQQGRASAAIKAKCLDCCGMEDVSNRIRDCEASGCPLWRVRPYQDKKDA